MTKKTLYIFSIIFLFSLFILPKVSFATVTLTASNLTSTSVTLNSSGLTSSTAVIFSLESLNSAFPYTASFNTFSNFNGGSSKPFYALNPLCNYKATIVYSANPSSILETLIFITPSAESSNKSITSFKFSSFNPDVVGVIDESSKMIALTVPSGTNITALVPTIVIYDSKATISPLSGVPKDFSEAVTYTVTAENGSTVGYTAVVFVENSIVLGDECPGNAVNYPECTLDIDGKCVNGKIPPECTTGNGSGGNGGAFTAFDNGGLVPCGTERADIVIDKTTGKETGGEITNPCEENGMKYLMDMINKIINYMLFVLALPIAAIMFAYAGFMLVVSGGEAGKRTKAKEIFLNVALGLILAAACWLIVNTILSTVGYDGSWIGFTN